MCLAIFESLIAFFISEVHFHTLLRLQCSSLPRPFTDQQFVEATQTLHALTPGSFLCLLADVFSHSLRLAVVDLQTYLLSLFLNFYAS